MTAENDGCAIESNTLTLKYTDIIIYVMTFITATNQYRHKSGAQTTFIIDLKPYFCQSGTTQQDWIPHHC